MDLPPRPNSIDQALDWHSATTDSVSFHRDAELAALRRGDPPIHTRFLGFTAIEIAEFFRAEQAEVDAAAVVSIVAAAEAALRADYRDRIRRRKKDTLTQAYVDFHLALGVSKQRRPDFDRNGIVDALRAASVVPDHLVSEFRRALHLRHWHAHGRYWLLRTKAVASPIDAHAISSLLIAAVLAI